MIFKEYLSNTLGVFKKKKILDEAWTVGPRSLVVFGAGLNPPPAMVLVMGQMQYHVLW